VTVTASALDGDEIEAVAADVGEVDRFPRDRPPPPPGAGGWQAYVRGTVAELQAAGHELRAARLHITGTVASGSGLSSSAALEVALCLALLGLAGVREPDRVELARVCVRVEHDWVGVASGLLDQLASLFGAPGTAVRIDFRTLSSAGRSPWSSAAGAW
jgi:galactokinase